MITNKDAAGGYVLIFAYSVSSNVIYVFGCIRRFTFPFFLSTCSGEIAKMHMQM